MKAIWNKQIIAESINAISLEGYYYFPKADVNMEYLTNSKSTSSCYWKGNAHYFNIEVAGKSLTDAAWHYPYPSDAARKISDHIAFDSEVEISD